MMKKMLTLLNWGLLIAWVIFIMATKKDIVDYLQPIKKIPFVIEMGIQGNAMPHLAMKGFSVPEPWGRWTEGERAEFIFFTDDKVGEPFDLVLFFDIMASPVHVQEVDITYNTQPLLLLKLNSPLNHCLRLDLPTPQGSTHHFILTISKPLAPISHDPHPHSQDARRLGIGLKRLVLVPKSRTDLSCATLQNALFK